MPKTAIVLLAGLLNLTLAAAQDFRPGFILKQNGDSLTGFVDNRSDKVNSERCYFKTSKRSKKVKYTPAELRGYGFIDDKYYETKEIRVHKNGKVTRATVFVEVLVKGQASLYRYLDVFYVERDSLFMLPLDSKSEVIVQDQTYQKSSKKYVALLNIALADCNLKADKVRYEERGLTYLIQNYNRCKGTAGKIYKAKKPWTKLSVSLFTGIDQSTVKLNGFNAYSINQSLSMPMGAGLEISSPRVSDKSHLSLELWYVKKFYQGYNETSGSGPYLRNDLFIDASFLKIPIGFSHNFLQESQTPYIKFGVAPYFTLNTSAQVLSETELNGVVTTNRTDVPMEKKNQMGLWVGVGFRKKLNDGISGFVEMRYEKNNGFTQPSMNYSSSGSVLNFLVGLKF